MDEWRAVIVCGEWNGYLKRYLSTLHLNKWHISVPQSSCSSPIEGRLEWKAVLYNCSSSFCSVPFHCCIIYQWNQNPSYSSPVVRFVHIGGSYRFHFPYLLIIVVFIFTIFTFTFYVRIHFLKTVSFVFTCVYWQSVRDLRKFASGQRSKAAGDVAEIVNTLD